MAFGPTRDGGYYLLSLSRPEVGIYDDVTMGENRVFMKMMANAKRRGLGIKTLEESIDVDTWGDLLALEKDPRLELGQHTMGWLRSHPDLHHRHVNPRNGLP
jgi:glycosyltransferase A (GT-A) superfamily protein (DUF2064 family)